MSDTMVTCHGWAGSDVQHRTVGGASTATFRLGVTPRIKRGGTWQDGETAWYSVQAWRTLADHLATSVQCGDPLVVHGRLRNETWRSGDGPAVTTMHIDALLVGHDLTRGTSTFRKMQRPDVVAQEQAGEVAAMVTEAMSADLADLDSWGERRQVATAGAGGQDG